MKNESGLTVTGDKVLIRPIKIEEKTAGGIVLPGATKDKEQLAQQMGWLVGIGPGALGAPELEGVNIGDVVLFPRYQQANFPFDGDQYWVMKVTSILGKATRLPDYVIRGADSSLSVFGSNSGVKPEKESYFA